MSIATSEQVVSSIDWEELRAAIAHRSRADGLLVAVAESLTGGQLAAELARAEAASEWFGGGVVSYTAEAKHRVLRVRPGPVVSETAVRDMAEGVAALFDATTTAAVSGVGGPGPQENQPAGTVWIAVHHRGRTNASLHQLSGSPQEICDAVCALALEAIARSIGAAPMNDDSE